MRSGASESACGEDPCSGPAVRASQPAVLERSAFATYPAEHLDTHFGGGAVGVAHLVPWICVQYGERRPPVGGEHADVASRVSAVEQGTDDTGHEAQLRSSALQGTGRGNSARALEYVRDQSYMFLSRG